MPARTGHTTYVPGRGATTVKTKKSGKQVKTFQGSPSKAPAGTKVIPESTAATAPTVEVKPSGKVVTRNYRRQAAEAEIRRAQRSRQRVDKIVSIAKSHEQAPKAIPVAVHARSLPTTKKVAPVSSHVRRGPTEPKMVLVDSSPGIPGERAPSKRYVVKNVPADPAKALISSVPGRNPNLKGTPAQRKAARAKVQQTKAVLKQSRHATQLPYLETPEQQKVARTVLRTGKQEGASRKELLAAAETGLVESYGFKNLRGGNADSEGWRQERRAFYPEPTNVKQGAKNFFSEAKTDSGPRGTAGELAQTVQGSAFPERYDERKPEANQIVKTFERGTVDPKAKAQYQAAVKEAKELGLKVSPRGINVGKPTKQVVTKFRQIKHAAAELESKGFPYSLGGGHDPNFSPGGEGENGGPGYDCSGAVSFVLHQAGVLKEPLTSGSMGSVLEPGPGAVTVFYNAEHTFMKIGNEYWGTSVGDSGAGGIGKHPAPSASYLAQYSVGHVPGLGKKQALQLGFKPGSLTSTGGSAAAFPGMTFSEGGTTATINPGAATEKQKAGPSKRPIKVDPQKQARQTLHKLKSLGAGLGEAREAEPTRASGLSALERKYGKAAV